jgi:hypothetical protein
MPEFIPYLHHPLLEQEQVDRAWTFYELCKTRRTIREFSQRPIPREVLELILKTAGTAPSGANKQPWRFVVVTDPDISSGTDNGLTQTNEKAAAASTRSGFFDGLLPGKNVR